MEHCGIDVHQKYTQICIVGDDGEVTERASVRTTRPALKKFFGDRERMRVVLEAGGSSPWVSRLLAELGHEVIVCSPRRVRLIAESTLKNDQIDAEVLARLVRLDPRFLKPIRHRSAEAQVLRAHLQVRRALVKARSGWINTVRGLLRGFGYRVPGGAAPSFADRVTDLDLPAELRSVLAPLLAQLDLVSEEIQRCDAGLEELARQLPVVEQLQQVPGVGVIVALTFVLTIDDPDRFRRSRDLAAYLGLRPRIRESGPVSHYGRITKEGDRELRRMLVQAAHALFRTRADSALKRWAEGLAARRGKCKAAVALARKLAVLMHHLWVTGETYQRFPHQDTAAA
jgi:transposase